MHEVTLSKIPKEVGNNFYIIQCEWHKESFSLTLLENGVAWAGKVGADEVNDFSERVGLNVEKYICETRTALASHNGPDQFSYVLEDEKFVWKKLVGNIKVKFGCIQLQKIPGFSTFEVLVGNVLDKINVIQDDVKSLRNENENYKADKEILMKKLEEYAIEKSNQEEALYGKFLAILNAKKERIKDLETVGPATSLKSDDDETDFDEPDIAPLTKQPVLECSPTIPKRKRRVIRSPSPEAAFGSASPDSSVRPSSSKQPELRNEDACHYDSDTQVNDYDFDEAAAVDSTDSSPLVITKSRMTESTTILPKRMKRGKVSEQNKLIDVECPSNTSETQLIDVQFLLDDL